MAGKAHNVIQKTWVLTKDIKRKKKIQMKMKIRKLDIGMYSVYNYIIKWLHIIEKIYEYEYNYYEKYFTRN